MPFTNNDEVPFRGTWYETAGVYGIMNNQREMVYIGQTDNFKRRMAEHQADQTHPMHRYGPASVLAEIVSDPVPRAARERVLIAEYGPPANQ